MITVALGHALALHHDAPARLWLGEAEVDGLFFRRNLDPLDPLQFLNPALDLLRLGRLVPEAGDKGFDLLDALLLDIVCRLLLDKKQQTRRYVSVSVGR